MSFYNIKPRLLWCPTCKIDSTSDYPSPACHDCGSQLITVTFSAIDGSRITGVEPAPFPIWQEVEKKK